MLDPFLSSNGMGPSPAMPAPAEGGEAPRLSVLRVLGIGFGIALMHALELLFGQGQLLRRITQHHQATDNRADGNQQDQPGIPGHELLLIDGEWRRLCDVGLDTTVDGSSIRGPPLGGEFAITGPHWHCASATMRADFDLPREPAHVRLSDAYHRRPGFPYP